MASKSPQDDTKPNTEERYTEATHATNLRVQAERGGSADMLIAAGWSVSASRVGAALIRLHSEWEGSEKPKRRDKSAIENIAKTELPLIANGTKKEAYTEVVNGKKVPRTRLVSNMVLDMKQANIRAHEWYMHALGERFQKLKTLPEVRLELVDWARREDMKDPEVRVSQVLSWWLDHRCPVCEGRAKEVIPGTPSLSHRDCQACRGTGETRIPADYNNGNYMRDSKKLLGYMHDCVKTAQSSIRSRLQPMKAKKPAPASS